MSPRPPHHIPVGVVPGQEGPSSLWCPQGHLAHALVEVVPGLQEGPKPLRCSQGHHTTSPLGRPQVPKKVPSPSGVPKATTPRPCWGGPRSPRRSQVIEMSPKPLHHIPTGVAPGQEGPSSLECAQGHHTKSLLGRSQVKKVPAPSGVPWATRPMSLLRWSQVVKKVPSP